MTTDGEQAGRAPLRLGTRRSALARAQSGDVAERVRALTGRDVVLVDVTTRGDTDRAPLSQIGGTGVFVSALREALLEGRVDLAVHSMKDLPTGPAEGLVVAAVPPREDPRDVLVAADGARLADLPRGAKVGTGSPRRAAQLRALDLGLEVVDVRGNVDTRIGYVTSGTLDAVVLARAGLVRLGREDDAMDVLAVDDVLPAAAQGALALECRADDTATVEALVGLEDPATRAATTAERTLLAALEAGCTAPVGALATPVGAGGTLRLAAVVAAPDGSTVLRRSATADAADAEGLGRRLAQELLDAGAADLVAAGEDAPGGRVTGTPAGGPAGRGDGTQQVLAAVSVASVPAPPPAQRPESLRPEAGTATTTRTTRPTRTTRTTTTTGTTSSTSTTTEPDPTGAAAPGDAPAPSQESEA